MGGVLIITLRIYAITLELLFNQTFIIIWNNIFHSENSYFENQFDVLVMLFLLKLKVTQYSLQFGIDRIHHIDTKYKRLQMHILY